MPVDNSGRSSLRQPAAGVGGREKFDWEEKIKEFVYF